MPLFDFECECGERKQDVYRSVQARDNPEACPRCHKNMIRQFPLVHTDLQDFHTPIEMFSVACNTPDEIRQMQRVGVPISDNPSDPMYGVPIAHNRSEKKKALKAAGFVETN